LHNCPSRRFEFDKVTSFSLKKDKPKHLSGLTKSRKGNCSPQISVETHKN
jgi:hypothetical protein